MNQHDILEHFTERARALADDAVANTLRLFRTKNIPYVHVTAARFTGGTAG